MFLIFVILVIFSVVLAFVWVWFFKNEKGICNDLYNSGLEAFKEEDYKKARDLFVKTSLANSNFEDVKYKLGFCHLKLKEYDGAKNCFEEVLKITPKRFDALFNLAQAFHFKKQYDKAEEFYCKALKENDKSSDCQLNIGLIFYEQKEYTKAIEFLDKAKDLVPDDSRTLFYINRCKDELCEYNTDDDCQHIIDEYLKMAESSELPPEFNIALAKAYAKSGKIEESLVYCQNALIVNPEDVESYKLLGVIQLIEKDFAAAKNTIATALNLHSKSEELHEILSYVICQQKDGCMLDKCREKYKELIKVFME